MSVVTDLARQLSVASDGGQIELDASNVSHMGALGTQLILCASRTARSAGGSVSFVAISDRATNQLAAMGLTPTMLSEGAT
ncbi:STAS domain-containing protein [Tateyamaria sp. SN3-11]|uniref:STAS domain-containing protein n=1 Tax=Tateyamaria sp. SN3-11 TaxID=3092147 RepID=UPI0039EAB617